jgi:integrase/recombinase XerD
MTRTSSVDVKLISRFLRTQHFRHQATPKNYAATLRNFSAFLTKHSSGARLTVSILQEWLKERSLKWPAHILYHRTLLIERYLKWLRDQGEITSNPFEELHLQYGSRTTPIVRALVSEDSNVLQRLRRPPPFGSFLGPVMKIMWRTCVGSAIATSPPKSCSCASIASCSAIRSFPGLR